jgi:hypothetical protein
MDPDWSIKLAPKRVNLRKWFIMLLIGGIWLNRRIQKVEEFDRLKR